MEHGTYNDFFKWLKYQCTQHTLLKHQDVPLKKVFFEADIEQTDFFTDSEVKPKDFCVVAFYPDLRPDPQSNISNAKHLVFFGYTSNTANNKNAIQEAMIKTEKLYLDFVERLNGDEYLLRKFLGSGAANISARARQNFYKDYSGYIVDFSIAYKISLCTDAERNPLITEKWLDNGITPNSIFD